jgi:hypothetical protein
MSFLEIPVASASCRELTEQTAIFTASPSNPALIIWLTRALAAGQINLIDPQTQAGLDALVATNLLTAVRENQILAGTPAPVSA